MTAPTTADAIGPSWRYAPPAQPEPTLADVYDAVVQLEQRLDEALAAGRTTPA